MPSFYRGVVRMFKFPSTHSLNWKPILPIPSSVYFAGPGVSVIHQYFTKSPSLLCPLSSSKWKPCWVPLCQVFTCILVFLYMYTFILCGFSLCHILLLIIVPFNCFVWQWKLEKFLPKVYLKIGTHSLCGCALRQWNWRWNQSKAEARRVLWQFHHKVFQTIFFPKNIMFFVFDYCTSWIWKTVSWIYFTKREKHCN